jgi:hypothetical protein
VKAEAEACPSTRTNVDGKMSARRRKHIEQNERFK